MKTVTCLTRGARMTIFFLAAIANKNAIQAHSLSILLGNSAPFCLIEIPHQFLEILL